MKTRDLTLHKSVWLRGLLALAIFTLSFNPQAQVASGGTFSLDRKPVAGAGAQTSGGTFQGNMSAGQAEASTTVTGGTFHLQGGFWANAAPISDELFRNGFEN